MKLLLAAIIALISQWGFTAASGNSGNITHVVQERYVAPTNETYTRLDELGLYGDGSCLYEIWDSDLIHRCNIVLIEPSHNLLVHVQSEWCVRYLKDVRKKLINAGFKRPNNILGADQCDYFQVGAVPHMMRYIGVRPFARGSDASGDSDEMIIPDDESMATLMHAIKLTVPGAEIALLVLFVGLPGSLIVSLFLWGVGIAIKYKCTKIFGAILDSYWRKRKEARPQHVEVIGAASEELPMDTLSKASRASTLVPSHSSAPGVY